MTSARQHAGGRTPAQGHRFLHCFLGAAAACFAIAAPAAALQDAAPPIFKPGPPGEPSRSLSAEESIELGQTRFTDADVEFMQHMIVHHSQAVEMNGLIADRSENPTLRLMGERIAISQESEIAMMRTWLTRRGQSTDMQMDHGAHHMNHGDMSEPSDVPLMPGMLSPKEMAELAAASGGEFDRLWLRGMIKHHQGAIDMVYALLDKPGSGQDPELSDFLGGVIADQSAEILRMQAMLATLS